MSMLTKTTRRVLAALVMILIVLYRDFLTGMLGFASAIIKTSGERGSTARLTGYTASSPNEDHRTYVLALSLSGQQGSGVRSLSVFQCVLSSIHKGFYIAEPSVKGSYLVATTAEKAAERLKFSSLFDIDHFNHISRSIGYPEMVRMKRFIQHSPSYTIYIYIRQARTDPGKRRIIWDANASGTNRSKIQCLNSELVVRLDEPYKGVLNRAKRILGSLKPRTCIVRVVTLLVCEYEQCNVSWTQTVNAVRKFIFGEWSPYNVTLVFTHWYNKFFVPVHAPLNGIHCMRRYAQNETKTQFRPSARLVADADKYTRLFLGGSNRLTIMLRAERVMKYYLKESGVNGTFVGNRSLKGCFNEVLALKQKEGIAKPFVTMDVGRFGTQSISKKNDSKKLLATSSEVLTSLYDNKWSVGEWEDSFIQAAGGITDTGYIAALQRTIASRADCLALMGGGSFQSLAVIDYIKYHDKEGSEWKPCVHLICVMTTSNTEVQKTIENYS